MSDVTKAVFLSYASQDAEAAKRICDALRAARVEVWFDADGGLEHGDQWDAKIRRQIKECVLFIAVISANTQAREEGYFRIEWDLAAERARGIASGVAFILPVVIDDTKEPAALVPDRFRAVQWTRLPGGEVSPEVLARLLKLWSHRTGVARAKAGAGVASGAAAEVASEDRGATTGRGSRRAVWIGLAAMVAAGVFGAFWFGRRSAGEGPSTSRAPAGEAKGLSEAAQLVTKAWAQIDKWDMGRAELDAAETLLQKAAELEPNNADAWAAWSVVNTWYVFHNWDRNARRLEAARLNAERALRLDPKSFHARYARALFLVRVQAAGSDRMALVREAESLLRDLLQERPDDPRVLYSLGFLLVHAEATHKEGLAFLERAAKHPAFTAMAWDEYGWVSFFWGEFAAAEKAAERSLAAGAYWNNLGLLVTLCSWVRGDLDAAKVALERMPPPARQEDMALGYAWQLYLWRKEPERAVAAMESVSRDWIRYFFVDTPRSFLLGRARLAAGQSQAAKRDLQRALELLAPRLVESPNDINLLVTKAHTLQLLDNRAEAEGVYRLVRELEPGTALGLLFDPPEEALAYVRRQLEQPFRSTNDRALFTAAALRRDPWFERVRRAPGFADVLRRAEEIERGLRGEGGVATGGAASERSIAVLAFKNLSGDPAREVLADGISEAVADVLGRVPGLKVTASASAFSFKGKNVPAPEIARQLGVTHLVEGTVLQEGTTVRITAKLIQADGFQVWGSEKLDRELKNVFALHDEVAALVAAQLSLRLGATSAAARTPLSSEAFELYVQARQEWNLRTPAGYDRAEALLNRALQIAPQFARAHAALADVWELRAEWEAEVGTFAQRGNAVNRRIRAKVAEALAIDPNCAEAHASLGLVGWNDWAIAESERALRRAIELNPNYASAHQWLGRQLIAQGHIEEALSSLRRAAQLDPMSRRILDNYGWALISAGRYSEALVPLNRALELQPDALQARWLKALALARLGRNEEARPFALTEGHGNFGNTPVRLLPLALVGDRATAEKAIARASNNTAARVLGLAALGRDEEALAAFEPGQLDYSSVDLLYFDPAADRIRRDPRFLAVLKEVGLTEAHARAQAWRAANPPETGRRTTEHSSQKTEAGGRTK